MVERLHRELKASLIAYNTRSSWTDELPLVVPGVGSSFKEGVGFTTAELVYCKAVCLIDE